MKERIIQVAVFVTTGLVHFSVYTATWGYLFAMGDAGATPSRLFSVFERVLAFPLMYLMALPPTFFAPHGRWWGDDSNFIIGLTALNSVAWASGMLVVFKRWRKRPAPRNA
jgi:hypothetical protein